MSAKNTGDGSLRVSEDERLRLLQETDLPLWLERAGAMCQRMNANSTAEHLLSLRPSQLSVTRELLIEHACVIGDHLCRRALIHEDVVVWMTPTFVKRDREWALRPVNIDWYDGIPGIALFLGYLGLITGEQQYSTLARLALQSVRFKIEQLREDQGRIGAVVFAALRSAIYLLTHLGALWNDEGLLREAVMLVEYLPGLITQDKTLDIINGTAGVIVSLLGLHTCVPSSPCLQVAQLGGEHLLIQARKMKRGWGWQTVPGFPPLTGMSHGAAGIAYSLSWLAAVSHKERFHAMALEGLAYERDLFSSEQKNWPHLLESEQSESQDKNGPSFRHFWCHGAPGIGLARLASLPYLHDELIEEEIEAALQTTLSHGFGHNHSLCHGDFGNLEMLLLASQTLYPTYRKSAEQMIAVLLESVTVSGWVCGAPLGIETPGLMRGLAGIGYQFLRLAAPEKVPSVLLFAPPAK
ncbi:MAG TPA: type 2 lanthipeptide synthetase LanM [Ktedonobacteraceae bacterium]|nr:type 2 lanthipeptide synthetase LanM [Ktedonobacteraceae bacterium]